MSLITVTYSTKEKKMITFLVLKPIFKLLRKIEVKEIRLLMPALQNRKCAMTSTLHCPLATSRMNLQGQEKGRPTNCGLDDRSRPWNTPTPGLPKASKVTQRHFTQPSTEAQKDFILWNPCNMSILLKQTHRNLSWASSILRDARHCGWTTHAQAQARRCTQWPSRRR